jgi:exonuclease VII small subunit
MIGAVIEKTVRRIAPDRGKAKLERALADLRVLVEALEKNNNFLSDAIRSCQNCLQRFNGAEQRLTAALAGKQLDEIEAALRQPEITFESVQRQLAMLNSHNTHRVPYMVFLSENEKAKELLEAVCKLRLEQAKTDAERVFRDEGARLGPEYDPNESPVVRRAQGKARSLGVALERIQTQAISDTFVPFASQLLSGE